MKLRWLCLAVGLAACRGEPVRYHTLLPADSEHIAVAGTPVLVRSVSVPAQVDRAQIATPPVPDGAVMARRGLRRHCLALQMAGDENQRNPAQHNPAQCNPAQCNPAQSNPAQRGRVIRAVRRHAGVQRSRYDGGGGFAEHGDGAGQAERQPARSRLGHARESIRGGRSCPSPGQKSRRGARYVLQRFPGFPHGAGSMLKIMFGIGISQGWPIPTMITPVFKRIRDFPQARKTITSGWLIRPARR